MKRYLFRIINTSFQSTFIFSIDNHLLQVVSTDFVPIFPYSTKSISVGIGQRYNVIVEADPLNDEAGGVSKDGNYWIRTHIANCGPSNETINYNTTGILRYNKTSTVDPTSREWTVSRNC